MSPLDVLIAKDEIRELAMLYSRGVDRKDGPLLRTLYTADATDTHDVTFDGPAEKYVDFLEIAFPHMRYSGHHICNHLISVNGNEGDGEVYAIAFHLIPDRQGGWINDVMCCRYIDRYRKEDGRWKFAKRVIRYDHRTQHPTVPEIDGLPAGTDPSYATLTSRLFARGERA